MNKNYVSFENRIASQNFHLFLLVMGRGYLENSLLEIDSQMPIIIVISIF